LKASLQARAKRLHRFLSAQITYDLEQLTAQEPIRASGGKVLGRYAGTKVPAEADFRAARLQLWRGMVDEAQ
jgi:hypothetical protein